MRDSDGTVVGDAFRTWGSRLAEALALRDLRLLRGGDGERGDTRLVRRRDPRARVQALLPFFRVARDATPLALGDTLWWAVTVAAATADYPLATHLALDGFDGEELASLRFAGTALVNAATGSVRLVPAPNPDADVRSWYARFPRLAIRADTLAAALSAALPIPYSTALAQSYVFAEFGARGSPSLPGRRVIAGDVSDSLGSARPSTAYVTPMTAGRAAVATTLPVIGADDRVAGVLVAAGGPTPSTTWVSAVPPNGAGLRWPDVLDSTAAPPDVVPAPVRRESPSASGDGPVRVLPTGAGLLFARAHYSSATDGRPLLTGVTAVIGDRVLRGPALLGLFTPGGSPAAVLPRVQTAAERVSTGHLLYEELRGALQRGDWPTFGRALDSIGRVLAPVP